MGMETGWSGNENGIEMGMKTETETETNKEMDI